MEEVRNEKARRNNKKKERKKRRIHVPEGEKEETNTIFDMQTNEINVTC